MLPEAYLTSHSRVSVSRWVITPSWLSATHYITLILMTILKVGVITILQRKKPRLRKWTTGEYTASRQTAWAHISVWLVDLPFCQLWKSSFLWLKKKKPKDTYPSHFTTAEILWLPPPKSMYELLWVCWHIKSNESLFNKITLKYMLAFQVVTIWCFLSNMSVASAWEHTQNLFSGDEISPSYLLLFSPKSICCHALFIIFGLNDFGLFSKLQTILKRVHH